MKGFLLWIFGAIAAISLLGFVIGAIGFLVDLVNYCGTSRTRPDGWGVFVDFIIAGVFAILPLLWLFVTFRQPKIKRADICQSCGYDLRATPDRCPECGTIPTRKRDAGSPV